MTCLFACFEIEITYVFFIADVNYATAAKE